MCSYCASTLIKTVGWFKGSKKRFAARHTRINIFVSYDSHFMGRKNGFMTRNLQITSHEVSSPEQLTIGMKFLLYLKKSVHVLRILPGKRQRRYSLNVVTSTQNLLEARLVATASKLCGSSHPQLLQTHSKFLTNSLIFHSSQSMHLGGFSFQYVYNLTL